VLADTQVADVAEATDADTAPGDAALAEDAAKDIGQDAAKDTSKDAAIPCALPTQWGIGGAVPKVSALAVSPKTEGCDLDGDGKPNNVLGKVVDLYKDLNKVLGEKIADGTLSILLAPVSYATDGTPFEVDVLAGAPDPLDAACDVTAAGANCAYRISKSSYDLESKATVCRAHNRVPGLSVTAGVLAAGTPPYVITLDATMAGVMVTLPVHVLVITGMVGPGALPQSIQGGRLCGFIHGDDAVCVPANGATPRSCVSLLLKSDIDTDGDGVLDGVSVSLDFAAVGGHVTGLSGK
jgi:hypothetical protein